MARKKNSSDVLREARRLLAKPRGWGKRYSKIRNNGNFTYCLIGAVAEASGAYTVPLRSYGELEETRRLSARAIKRLAKALGTQGISDFNDKKSTRKKDVLALIDKALEVR